MCRRESKRPTETLEYAHTVAAVRIGGLNGLAEDWPIAPAGTALPPLPRHNYLELDLQ